MTNALEQVNLESATHDTNPYADYEVLRREAPVYRYTFESNLTYWIVTRYEDVLSVLKDPRFVRDFQKVLTPEQLERVKIQLEANPEYYVFNHNMLSTDPPAHTRLRNLVSKAFTPRRIEQLRPRIEQIADELLDKMQDQTEVDLINSYAFPLPLTVICEMLGIPQADRGNFREWSNTLIDGTGPDEPEVNRQKAARLFLDYLYKLVAQHRQTLGKVGAISDQNDEVDLITALMQAEEQGQKLNENELLAMIWLLIIAGHETTVNLIANGILALLEHPEQLAKLKQNLGLIKPAIEELLRYDGPVDNVAVRFATEDIELAGQQIARGEKVIAVISSANRDTQQFKNAADLDIERTLNQHLAFGHGLHYCLGAPLARLEGQVAIPKLLERFPDLRLAVAPSELKWRPSILLRGLKELPIILE